MATLVTKTIDAAGINPETTMTAATVTVGDKIVPGDRTFLRVKNSGGSPITVAVNDPNSVSPTGATSFNADLAVSVTNAQERWIGPITSRFAEPADGLAVAICSVITSVTVGAFQL